MFVTSVVNGISRQAHDIVGVDMPYPISSTTQKAPRGTYCQTFPGRFLIFTRTVFCSASGENSNGGFGGRADLASAYKTVRRFQLR